MQPMSPVDGRPYKLPPVRQHQMRTGLLIVLGVFGFVLWIMIGLKLALDANDWFVDSSRRFMEMRRAAIEEALIAEPPSYQLEGAAFVESGLAFGRGER